MSADRLKDWELGPSAGSPPPGDPAWAWPNQPGSGAAGVWPPPNIVTSPVDAAPPPVFAQGGWPPPQLQHSWQVADPNVLWPVSYGPARGYLWAGMGDRLIAMAIDAVIVALAFGLVALVEWRYGPGTDQTATATIAWMAFVALYEPLAWWILKGTPGQLARRLHVVKAKDGRRLWPHRSIWRYAVQLALVSVIAVLAIPAIWLRPILHRIAGPLWGADDPRGRAIWDRAAGSVVVRRM